MKKKVLLKSPLLTCSGYGKHALTVLRALREYEEYFDIYLIPLNWGHCGWIWEDNEERQYIDSLIAKTSQYNRIPNPQYDIFLHCTIPLEWEQKAPINIGITAGIETTKIAPQWVEKSQLMNKIIVVSEHAKYGFVNTSYPAKNEMTGEMIEGYKCDRPIEVIGYPTKFISEEKREKIDINIETDFNYLVVAQWSGRKNIERLITWFVEENIDRDDVGLVCKLNIAANSRTDKFYCEKKLELLLNKYPNRKCKVYLIHGDLNESQMAFLYTHPKIKAGISISPEGFGLFAYESSYYGLPLMTYGWGGTNDFMYMNIKNNKGKMYKKAMFAEIEYEMKPIPQEIVWDGVLIKDSQWAYPKEGSFKVKMRDMRVNYSEYKEMALTLQKYLIENYSEEKIYKKYAESIYGASLLKVSIDNLPKVSIITSVFKAKEYLEECFKDVEKQTIFKNKCEHIIVHPKTSPEFEKESKIIWDYLDKYPGNVKYIQIEEDGGLYDAWNIGIKNSSGEYITNWNCDDRRSPECIEKSAKELFSNQEVGFIYFDQFITDKSNETFENNSSNGKKYNFPEYEFNFLKMMNLNHAMGMWRKSLHDKYGMFNAKYKSAGDWELTLRCCAKGEKMKKLNGIYGLYMFNAKGISTNPENFDWKRKEEEEIYNTYKDIEI